jgi:hypothetical protein
MPITNNPAIKYLIKRVVSNDGSGNIVLQPIWPQTIGSQILPETSYRQLSQTGFVLGGTYDAPGGTLSGNTTTVQVGSPTVPITLTLPSVSGTLATLDDVAAVVVSVSDGIFDLDNTNGVISVSPYTTAAAGKFNNSSTLTAGTTALGYSGNFYANKLFSGGNEVVTAISDSGLTTGEAITSISITDNQIVVTRDSFLHLGTSGANINQTVYGTKTFNSTITGSVSGNAGTVTTSADNSTNASRYVLFADAVSGSQAPKTDTGLTYNPSTNTLTASAFVGALTGNASSATQIATTQKSDSVEYQVPFVTSVTAGNQSLFTDSASSITFNPSTNNLTLSGDLLVNGGDITTTSATFNIGNSATTAQTLNLGTAATAAATTKIVNLGTGGAANSTTNINIGSSVAGVTTISSPTVSIPGNLMVTGNITVNNVEMVSTSNGIIFEGATNDNFETTLTAIDPTADRTISLPNESGTVALTSDIGLGEVSFNIGTDLTALGGSTGFSVNEFIDTIISISHADVARTNNTSTASPSYGGTFTVIDTITSSETGHITAVNTKTVTLPASDNTDTTYSVKASTATGGAQLDLDAGGSGSGTDSVKFLGSGGTTITRTDADTITVSSTVVNNNTITLTAGNGLVTGGDFTLNQNSNKTITFDLGTPGTLTSSTTNAASADSHTHAITNFALSGTANVVSVSGLPRVLGEASSITLLAGHGDTVNPYASKTANTILAAPNGSNGTPSFRALVNADLPNSGVTAGTYSVVTVDAKGIATAGFQNVQVGFYQTSNSGETATFGATAPSNTPANLLIAGGLFFEAMEPAA